MNEPTDPAGTGPRDAVTPADAVTPRDTTTPVDEAAPDDATTPSPRWHRHPRALWRRSSDRVIVLPPGQSDLLLLEGTGAVIWEVLAAPTDEHELVDLLAEATDTDRAIVAPEVAAFLAQLATEHVIRQP